MNKKISLTLSSGGARGLAHIGVIEVLLENNYEIEQISGSSIGSVVASMYASGALIEFKNWVLSLDKLKVFSLMDFTIGGHGVMKGDKVFNKLKTIVDDQNIEDLKIPIKIIATDAVNGKEIVFSKGSVYDAMRASCSIPGLVKPFVYNNTQLVDGGVLNPLPINHLCSPTQILSVNLNETKTNIKNEKTKSTTQSFENSYFKVLKEYFYFNKTNTKRLSFFDLTYKSIHLMQNKLANEMLLRYPADFVVNIPFDSCYPLEFYKAKKMIKIGRDICVEALKNPTNKVIV